MEHLSLEIFDREKDPVTGEQGSQYATMEEDASITITDTSEVFASGDVWSYSFRLNVRANAHIFGSAGDMHGARLHDQLHRRRARLWVEGLPLLLGYLILGDEAEVDQDGNVDVSFEAGSKTFEEMIEGAKANQVPMMDDVLIGMALWRKRWASYTVKLQASVSFKDKKFKPTEYEDVTIEGTAVGGSIAEKLIVTEDGEKDGGATQQYPRMVFPRGTFRVDGDGIVGEESLELGGIRDGQASSEDETVDIDCINTDYPYDDAHPYCNTAVCYQKYGYEKKVNAEDGDSDTYQDYSAEPEAMRGYEVMPANRVNSAPNFFVIYWIKALMKHLGIYIEENQMMDVEDLRRLFFVNTNCAYREPNYLRTVEKDPLLGRFTFAYDGRNIQRLVPEYFGRKDPSYHNGQEIPYWDRTVCVDQEKSDFGCTSISGKDDPDYKKSVIDPEEIPEIDKVDFRISEVGWWDDGSRQTYERRNGYLHYAYATPECFPDADISEVISAIESGFGIRLLFSGDYKRVRIVLLRNIFRDTDVQQLQCDILSEGKMENSVRGFRMTYGDSDDTAFYYKGFADKLPHKKPYFQDTSDKHDYSHWKLNADYAKLINKVSAFDKTCYVDPNTGNAYGIKIDKDAKRYSELHPSLFEYAGFMDAEDGDCSGEEETIETISVGFAPAIMNDVNADRERDNGEREQRFALFVDETMRPRRPDLEDLVAPETYDDPAIRYDVDGKLYAKNEDGEYVYKDKMAGDGIVMPGLFAIRSDMHAAATGLRTSAKTYIRKMDVTTMQYRDYPVEWNLSMAVDGHINEGVFLYLQDNYEPNDTGVCPIETHDWGLTLGIMRGSGKDAYVKYEADPDDGEGNDTWNIMSGTNVISHPDTCDAYGNRWDYNGTGEGIGSEEGGRVSLKLRAEKPNPDFNKDLPEGDGNRRYLGITGDGLKGRGLIDQFYKEYSYWTRNARIAKRVVRMSLAELLEIDKTKRVTVGDITGFIRKMQYTVSNDKGLGTVTMEIMYI